nr:immunoglobulin heavy chain junction region [Macaca mulatta]MOV89535.1 immunoglobulin heavy chain junction region [Macaca mulatta]
CAIDGASARVPGGSDYPALDVW